MRLMVVPSRGIVSPDRFILGFRNLDYAAITIAGRRTAPLYSQGPIESVLAGASWSVAGITLNALPGQISVRKGDGKFENRPLGPTIYFQSDSP
jgi:hypothetical protein